MLKHILWLFLITSLLKTPQLIALEVTFGSFKVINFESEVIGDRELIIYRPNESQISDDTKFLIFQDGQMLFDAKVTWNNEEWELDETFSDLSEIGIEPNVVIIGVKSANKSGKGFFDNTNRYLEYFPKQAISQMKPGFVRFGYKRMGEKTHYNYLDFLTGELIPFLQTEFGIRLNRENMGIIGASMGAIAALNAILEHPELFGFAGCFSTHWIGIKPLEYLTLPFRKKIQGDQTTIDSLISYVKARSKNLDSHYIYFDRGTEGLDSAYEGAQDQIDLIFESERLDYKSLVFEGEGHYERFWARRVKSFFLDLYSTCSFFVV